MMGVGMPKKSGPRKANSKTKKVGAKSSTLAKKVAAKKLAEAKKKAEAQKKALAAKKVAEAKKVAAKKLAEAKKKAEAQKKALAAKKAAAAKKVAEAKKAVAAKKAAAAKKVAEAKKAATAKKAAERKAEADRKAEIKRALFEEKERLRLEALAQAEEERRAKEEAAAALAALGTRCELSGFYVKPSPSELTSTTIGQLREKLVKEKEELERKANEFLAEAEALAREREGGDTQFDEESGDGDTINTERERDLLLSASARAVVEQIDEALERIKNGTYGVCTPAGRAIPLERLEAIPWADVCVDCKSRADRRR